VVAGSIIPFNTATPAQNQRMRQVNDWIGRQPNVTFADTRAAVAASGNPDALFESPTACTPVRPATGAWRKPSHRHCNASFDNGILRKPQLRGHESRYNGRYRQQSSGIAMHDHCLPPGLEQLLHRQFKIAMRILASIAAAAAVITSLSAQETPQKTFKASTNTVALYATVTDPDKRLVPDLAQEDFEVYDNGKLQTLTTFDNRPQPISVIVMLDTSGSMTLALDLVKAAAEQFLIRLMPEDQAMVGAFNDKIELHPEGFTNMRDDLVRALRELDFGYPTRLYDAVNVSMQQLKGIPGRRVVLVFTDGDDNSSKVGSGEVTDRGRLEDVMVYSVGLENEYFDGARRCVRAPTAG
jgi:hypothetical protein